MPETAVSEDVELKVTHVALRETIVAQSFDTFEAIATLLGNARAISRLLPDVTKRVIADTTPRIAATFSDPYSEAAFTALCELVAAEEPEPLEDQDSEPLN